jgi:hypothetical protein
MLDKFNSNIRIYKNFKSLNAARLFQIFQNEPQIIPSNNNLTQYSFTTRDKDKLSFALINGLFI